MSKIVLYPANGFDFDAADVAAYLAARASGVFSSAEDFPVTAAGGLKVTVGAGRGWVHPSRFTGYSITKREADTLTMPLADPSLPRIDRIVMRYDAGARAASLHVLQGTASSTPTAPAISRTELIYDLCLAEITRPAGSTNITTGQITDTRLDEALCGIVRDDVTGIPTEELIASARERINALEETASAAAKEADASKTAAARSEANSEAYKEAAATSESNAAGSASASAGSAAAAARSKSAAAGSATAAAGSASEAAGSAGSAKQDADRAAEAANNAANAATDALKKAKDAGDFKGDKGDTGPQGPSGTIIRAYDITLPAADWAETSDDEAKAAGWSYQCDATVSGCTAELEPSATISISSVPDAQKAGLGTICRTGAGYCRFYATTVPSADIHLRLLLMERVPT